MSNDLVRFFSVAMPEGLLMESSTSGGSPRPGGRTAAKWCATVRDALVEEECATPGALVMGTLTIIYDHHSNDLQRKLHTIASTTTSTIILYDARTCGRAYVLGGYRHAR